MKSYTKGQICHKQIPKDVMLNIMHKYYTAKSPIRGGWAILHY